MALAIDSSTPAIAVQPNNATTTVTTASFTPPDNSLLYIRWSWNTLSGGTPSTPTITDNLGVHLTYTLIDHVSRADSPACNGQAAHWWAPVATSAAMTVTVTAVNSGLQGGALHVTVLTGAHASPIGAHGKGASTSAGTIAQNYTAQATGGWGFIGVADWDLLGAETAGTGCTLTNGGSGNAGSEISYGFVRRSSADDSNGASNTLNVTLPGTSTNLHWVYAEVLPAAAGGSTDLSPQWSPGFMTGQGFPSFLDPIAQPAQRLLPYDASGAITYLQSLSGSATPAGALAKADSKPLAGATTPAGALAKQAQKALTGSFTPSGTLTTIKVVLRSFAGAITPAGTLAKLAGKALTGASTPAGALAKQDQKPLAGSTTPAGALAKLVSKPFSGSLTPTGALTNTRVILRAFAGSLTAGGTLRKQAGKALAGATTPTAAAVRKAVTKALAAAVSAAGSLAKAISRPFSGSTTPAGSTATAGIGATARATSTATLAAGRSSASTITDRQTSTPAVAEGRAATPTLSTGRASTDAVAANRTSTPGVT